MSHEKKQDPNYSEIIEEVRRLREEVLKDCDGNVRKVSEKRLAIAKKLGMKIESGTEPTKKQLWSYWEMIMKIAT